MIQISGSVSKSPRPPLRAVNVKISPSVACGKFRLKSYRDRTIV
jgi:hypothetical protein